MVVWWTMLVEPFDIVIRFGCLAECGSCAAWRHDTVKLMTIAHDLFKLNVETIPRDGPHHEWTNVMVLAFVLSNQGWCQLFGGDGQKLLLATMPGSWWRNGWFGLKKWTQTSTKIPLESSLQRLPIGVIKTWWLRCEIIQKRKVQNSAASMSFWLCPD